MRKFAILIDGGFAKVRLGSRENPVSSADFKRLVERICKHPFLIDKYLHRVYFYDAPPFAKSRSLPLGGGRRDFQSEPLTQHNQKLHRELTELAYFAVRLGETRFRGWVFDSKGIPPGTNEHTITAADFRPSIQQKGVDMRIGLDIASLALKAQVEVVVLVNGDSDFVPPMKFARREGLQFALVALGHAVNPDLLEHADFSLDLPED